MALDLSKTHQLSACGNFWELKPGMGEGYKASLDAQMEAWIKGINKHTENLPEGMEPECTPDFACCHPNLAWPLERRKKFKDADKSTQESMLFSSLGSLLTDSSEKNPEQPIVYLTTDGQSQLIGNVGKIKSDIQGYHD